MSMYIIDINRVIDARCRELRKTRRDEYVILASLLVTLQSDAEEPPRLSREQYLNELRRSLEELAGKAAEICFDLVGDFTLSWNHPEIPEGESR